MGHAALIALLPSAVAIKDVNFGCIRNLPVAETRPEHFDRALADGKVSKSMELASVGEKSSQLSLFRRQTAGSGQEFLQ